MIPVKDFNIDPNEYYTGSSATKKQRSDKDAKQQSLSRSQGVSDIPSYMTSMSKNDFSDKK